MSKFTLQLTIAITGLLITAMPVNAQSSNQPDEIQAVFACKTISAPLERLACYDNSVGRFEAAETSGEIVTVNKTAIEKVERDAFGFNIPSLPSLGKLFGGRSDKSKNTKTADKKDNDLTAPLKQAERTTPPKQPVSAPNLPSKPEPTKVTEVTLDIRKTAEFGYKKTRFFMANGQVWEQADGLKIRIPKVRNGQANTARISKASLGSFFLRVNGKGSAIRVRRVR